MPVNTENYFSHDFGTVIEDIPYAILIHSDGIILYANTICLALFGRQDLTGKSVFELVPQDMHPLVRERLRLIGEGIAKPGLIEMNGLAPDGTEIPVEVNSRLSRYGNRPAIVSVIRKLNRRGTSLSDLHVQDSMFNTIYQNAGIPISLFDLQGRWIDCNRKWEDLVGYTSAELSKLTISGITHPDDREKTLDYIYDLFEKGTSSRSMEKRYIRKNGVVVWAELSITPLRDTEGTIYAFIGAATDITEKKNTTVSLEESERRFRDMISNVRLLLVMLDRKGDILFMNSHTEKILGIKSEEAIGKNWFDSFVPNPRNKADFIESFNREIIPLHVENIIRTTSGRLLHMRWNRTIIHDENGATAGIASIGEDITAQKKHERQSDMEELRLRSLLHISTMRTESEKSMFDYALAISIQLTGSPIGYVYFYDEETQLFTLHAWSPDVMDVCSIESPLHVYELAKTGIWGEAVRQRKTIIINDFKAPNPLKQGYPPGHVELTRFLTVPVFEQGKIVAVVGVGNKEDSYDRIDESNLKLFMQGFWEIINRKRTEISLKKALDDAKSANRAKSEFLANMSHEIRTPLNAIIGVTDLLFTTSVDHEQQEYLDMIRQAGNSLLSVINDILDLSRIEAGQIVFENIDFEAASVLQGTIEIFRQKAKEKDISISYSIDDDVPEILMGDPMRLQQVLINLIGNAIKFTPGGEISICMKTKDHNLEKNYTPRGQAVGEKAEFLFSIADTGIGIPKDKSDMIFESFSQADSSTTRKHGGSGLGLAICRKLVHLMNGRIWVESEQGIGSTFFFTVTLGLHRQKKSKLSGYEQKPESAGSDVRKILLTEDNEFNRILAERLLKRLGHSVSEAKTGRECVEKLREERFDLILMDLQMPEMDGLEATARIRRGEAGDDNAGIPIIAMTAHAMKEDRERCLAAGMNEYITKPFSIKDLVSVINRCF